jgi:2-amino-4-hydroxy-6-hydroxymethyldihydropteridine diphosphokinase
MKRAFIGLGSNLGNPLLQIQEAITSLKKMPGTVKSVSSIYTSKPMGPQKQPDYFNAVVLLLTPLKPLALLHELQKIEVAQHRERLEHWGPRTIDLDILLYGEEVIETPELIIPHRGLTERAFVLQPLFEIAPALILPSGERLSELMMDIESLPIVE